MKRLAAIALSLLLVWVQVFVLAQPAGAAAPTACRCCECEQMDCCVAENASTTQPLAAVPVPTAQLNFNLFALPVSPAWLLPPGELDILSAISVLPLPATRVPLFTRHCALLI